MYWPTSPPGDPVTVADARRVKIAELMVAFEDAFAPLNAIYPPSEREGWIKQESEAKAFLGGSPALTPILSGLIQVRGRGESLRDFATLVLSHAHAYNVIYAALTGQQQRMYREINQCRTVAAVQAYEIKFTVPTV